MNDPNDSLDLGSIIFLFLIVEPGCTYMERFVGFLNSKNVYLTLGAL
jgi:hypothetical protein